MSPSTKGSAGHPGSPPGHTPQSRWATVLGKVALTLALGGAGGWLLAQVGAPAPWLTGSMLAVAAAALSGLPLGMPNWMRTLAFVMLGISIGSSVTPEALGEIQAWPGSVCLLLLGVAATTAASAFHLTRARGWDVMTARYCALPGALSQVLVLATRSRADLPRIALAQSLRVFVLVALLPWLIPAQGEAGPALIHAAVELTMGGSAAMLTVGLATGVLFDRLGIPGGALLGGMIASALLHGTGVLEGQLPGPLPLAAFVATGCVIGLRFRGASLFRMRATVRGGLESVALAIMITAAFALAAHYWLDLPYGQLWLAYAPGGVEAMTIMAFALGFDPAFVGGHHVIRIIAINLVIPLWLRGSGSGQLGLSGAKGAPTAIEEKQGDCAKHRGPDP
jgi:membrane AbrB-like protein